MSITAYLISFFCFYKLILFSNSVGPHNQNLGLPQAEAADLTQFKERQNGHQHYGDEPNLRKI